MQWFKHDTNASNDAKLRKVMIRYGLEGYGLYWYCLELIAGDISNNNLSFQLEHDAELIGHAVGMHQDKVQEIMSYMVQIGLFENSEGVITCLKMLKRLDSSMTSSKQMRELIIKAKGGHDEVMMKSCKKEEKERKEKKEKIDQIRKNAGLRPIGSDL